MPYLPIDQKHQLNQSKNLAKTDGDFNYLFSVTYLNAFIRNVKYSTIALIRKASVEPHRLEEVELIEDFLILNGVSELDRQIARELAFAEFYERVGKVYEKWAREKNGDLEEYKKALVAIVDKFCQEDVKCQAKS